MTADVSDRRRWVTLGVAVVALFMAGVDNLVLNVAMPAIAVDLNADTSQLQWIVAAYTLTFASLQITAGGLGDRYGRRLWFVIGLAIFTGASVMGAMSGTVETLLAARAAQGVGSAFLFPLSLALIVDAFPRDQRSKALGIWGATSVSGIAFGPIVGGALVEAGSWHWGFWINVPIGLAAIALTLWGVQESRATEAGPLDVAGTLTITSGVAALTWSLIEAGDRGWNDRAVVVGFVVAGLLILAFTAIEKRAPNPMVPLRFFKSRNFTGANIDGLVIAFLMSGVAFSMTLYVQNIHGFSPLDAGFTLLPLVIAMMVGSPIAGAINDRAGPSRLIALGMLVIAGGVLILLTVSPEASVWGTVPALAVIGAGMSLTFTPMVTVVLNSVDDESSGVASAVNGAIREVGTALGVAVLGTVMAAVYRSTLTGSATYRAAQASPGSADQADAYLSGGLASAQGTPPASEGGTAIGRELAAASADAFVGGMHTAALVSAGLAILAAAASYFLIRDSNNVASIPIPVPDPAAHAPALPRRQE